MSLRKMPGGDICLDPSLIIGVYRRAGSQTIKVLFRGHGHEHEELGFDVDNETTAEMWMSALLDTSTHPYRGRP